MNLVLKLVCFGLICLLSTVSCYKRSCVNRFEGRPVRASGDWSTTLWNAADTHGLLRFDELACLYTLSVGGLRPNTQYKWKVTLDNLWVENYGCNGLAGPDCIFKSNEKGEIRFIFRPDTNPPRLSTETSIDVIDILLPCKNLFEGKDVRVTGDWSALPLWNGAEPKGLMTFDSSICSYVLVMVGLKPSFSYFWKVTISNTWVENYGCNGLNAANCGFKTDADGAVRFIFKPDVTPPQLLTDYVYDSILTTGPSVTVSNIPSVSTNLPGTVETLSPCVETGPVGTVPTVPVTTPAAAVTTPAAAVTTPAAAVTTRPVVTVPATPAPTANPVKPCSVSSCPCVNNFSSKLIRATGDWTVDVGSAVTWDATESNGLLTYVQDACAYSLVVLGLKPNFAYKWKITIDNAWKENYGCTGLAAADCSFKSNSAGAIRFIVKTNTNVPQLTTDYNVAECGDGICETGETCSFCPADCGECPPPVCGDGVCDEGQTYLTCPEDCDNELPGCDRFNDESCQSGSQFHANAGVEKRRWQTPKPGAKGYQASYQDYHSLVGYADIRYTSSARTEADVCIVAIHKNQNKVTLQYYFNDEVQSANCKRFTSSHKTTVALKVTASDSTKLVIPAVTLYWNAKPVANRAGDYRSGQKGGIAEMFGWPHKDVEKECEILSKAGYLGVKLFPVHEQVMSHQPFNNVLNPWYFMYQPVSYKLDGRGGTREELQSLIDTCRSLGVRVYVDVILNHFTGAGNDMLEHRNPSAGCARWGNKTSSAPIDRQSPFYSHAYTYQYNPNTGEPPSNEFPGAALGPEDFHCERSLGSWSDLFILNNGWLVGLIDIDTSKDNVRDRQAAYIVEMMSMGVSGFRLDASKHMSPEDLSGVLKKIQQKMGGKLPDDFFVWLEIITGGEAQILWSGSAWYGSYFTNILLSDLGSQSEVDKIKLWDGLYPKEPFNNPSSKHRVVIQNDDHDQQNPGSTSRDMAQFGCVLVKNCPESEHRSYEVRLFQNPYGVSNNADDWPIRFVLSSYYHTNGPDGIPDGFSDCSLCTVSCETCKPSVPYMPAYVAGECAYRGSGYTRVHRDIKIINAMRSWINLGPITGADIGLPGCS